MNLETLRPERLTQRSQHIRRSKLLKRTMSLIRKSWVNVNLLVI